LLSAGNLRAEKGACYLDLGDLLEWGAGLEMAVLPGRRIDAALERTLGALAEAFPNAVRLGATCLYRGNDGRRLAGLTTLARRVGVPTLALGDVLYHAPERRRLQDVLSCVREHVTLDNAGRLLEANAERHLKSPAEMARLFADVPGAVTQTLAVLERLAFSLDELSYEYPLESAGMSATPFDELVRLTWEGAANAIPTECRRRYGKASATSSGSSRSSATRRISSPSGTSSALPAARGFCARGAARRPIPPSASAWG
jgi:error-prone DNA polymerase